jgi:hypothetical protein
MVAFQGVTLLLKATLPTCVLSHHGLSLLQHAPRSSPYDMGAGSHASCNRTKWAHPFDSNASSMEAQAHTSCNRRAGCYVQETAPPLAPLPCLLDCGTSTATRGNPVYDPIVPTRHVGHGSVSRGRRRDGRYGQKWAGSNGGGRRAEAAVKSSAKLTSPPGTAREPSPTA